MHRRPRLRDHGHHMPHEPHGASIRNSEAFGPQAAAIHEPTGHHPHDISVSHHPAHENIREEPLTAPSKVYYEHYANTRA